MEISFFLKGIIVGFSIAAPVGPIGILCIRRTLQFGKFSGLASGLGADFADAAYAIIAAFGLTFVSNMLVAGQFWFRLIGGGFLLYLGLKTYFAKQSNNTVKISHTNLLGDFVSTFLLTLTNPMTVLSFIAIFAGLGLSSVQESCLEAFTLVLGVLLGSAAWWLLLNASFG
jgi:threonine/homoserine/homoserine lactone efflux protein